MTAATATVVALMESLPAPVQERILEHLRDYIEDMQWDESFTRTQDKLAATATRARAEVSLGFAIPLEPDQL